MEMQQAGEERRAFWVTNWKQANTRELSARVPSPTVNLYTVLGHLIPTEEWHSLPLPPPILHVLLLIAVIRCVRTDNEKFDRAIDRSRSTAG